MTTTLIDKVQDFLEKQEKVYLQPGEKAPEGVVEQVGPKGGRYYISEIPKEKVSKPADWDKWDLEGKQKHLENLSSYELHPYIHDPHPHIRHYIAERINRKYLPEMSKDVHYSVRDLVEQRLHSIEIISGEVLQYFEKFHRLPEELPESFTRIFNESILHTISPALVTKPVIEELYKGTPFCEFHTQSIGAWERSTSDLLSGLLQDSVGRNYDGKVRYHVWLNPEELEKANKRAYQQYFPELVDKYVKTQKELTKRFLDMIFPKEKEIEVYRGTSAKEIVEEGEQIEVFQNPISSWTLKMNVAKKFAVQTNGIILRTKIPKSDIWSTFMSHAYQGNEHEILVIGKPKRVAEVIWRRK